LNSNRAGKSSKADDRNQTALDLMLKEIDKLKGLAPSTALHLPISVPASVPALNWSDLMPDFASLYPGVNPFLLSHTPVSTGDTTTGVDGDHPEAKKASPSPGVAQVRKRKSPVVKRSRSASTRGASATTSEGNVAKRPRRRLDLDRSERSNTTTSDTPSGTVGDTAAAAPGAAGDAVATIVPARAGAVEVTAVPISGADADASMAAGSSTTSDVTMAPVVTAVSSTPAATVSVAVANPSDVTSSAAAGVDASTSLVAQNMEGVVTTGTTAAAVTAPTASPAAAGAGTSTGTSASGKVNDAPPQVPVEPDSDVECAAQHQSALIGPVPPSDGDVRVYADTRRCALCYKVGDREQSIALKGEGACGYAAYVSSTAA